MYKVHFTEVTNENVSGGKGLWRRWLISKEHGAENYAMRYFEIEPMGYSIDHSHDYEHEIFILKGSGVIKAGTKEEKFREGDAIFIPPNERHQLINDTNDKVAFLCIIPIKAYFNQK
ncbi:MAG: cupin domain-containing protein [bacterium]